jgi:ribosomal protein L21E
VARPDDELPFHRFDDSFQLGEVVVVQIAASVGLPDPFDRVRLWTVRRKGLQGDAFGVALRANIDETVLLVLITEQGENRNQCEGQ